jgi:hypothetical protein
MKTKDEIREELLKCIDSNGLTLEGVYERLLCDYYEHTIDNLLQVLGELQVPEVRMTWSNDQKEDLLWLFDFCESIDIDSWKLIVFPSLK